MPLKPYITLTFNSPVWRMEIDETSDTLFFEIRDIPNKQVSFAGINLNTGNTNFKGLTLPERWLSGLEAANNSIMLVNGFQGETLPVHKGLTGVNGSTGTVLWSDYNITFEQIVESGFVVSDARIQPKKPFVINCQTGQRVSAYEPLLAKDPKTDIKYSRTITADAIITGLNLNLYGNEAYYLKHNKYRIVSLHALNEGALTQHLYVLDEDNNIVFNDIIAQQIQKLQPEAFINYKNKLIWLKNRSVVNVLNL